MYTSLYVWWDYGGEEGLKKPLWTCTAEPSAVPMLLRCLVWFHFGSLMSVFMGGRSVVCGLTPPLIHFFWRMTQLSSLPKEIDILLCCFCFKHHRWKSWPSPVITLQKSPCPFGKSGWGWAKWSSGKSLQNIVLLVTQVIPSSHLPLPLLFQPGYMILPTKCS